MRKKRFLSVLCLLLVLLMLPLSGFAETIEAVLPETEEQAVTEDNSNETAESAELSTDGKTDPAIDLSEYKVVVKDGEIYINGEKADEVVQNNVVTDVSEVWSNGDSILSTILGKLLMSIKIHYLDGKFTNIGETILSELKNISSQLTAIQEQISKSTQEIIEEVDYQAMVERYNEIDQYLASFMRNYFGNDAEAKTYISVMENINNNEYATETGRDLIDQTLHKAYSYYDLNTQKTSPITGYEYNKTYEQRICKDLLEMGDYLLGKGFSIKKSNVFQLYQGICSHVYGFNIETLETREKTNENLWIAYEAGYALLIPAINYDKDVHQKQMDEKQKVADILTAAIESGRFSKKDKKILEDKVRDLNHEINIVHKAAVDADASYIEQIEKQKDELLKNREISDNTIQEEKDAASGADGVMLSYQTGKYFYTTLVKVSYNYGREDAANCTYACTLVREGTASASGYVSYYLIPELVYDGSDQYDQYEVNKSDREMTKNTNYQNVVSTADLDTLQSSALKRNTTLYNQLDTCCLVSTDTEKRTGGTAFKDDDSALYYDGFQWAGDESEKKGCSAPDDKVAFHRTVKAYRNSDPGQLTEFGAIYKSWESKAIQGHDHKLVVDTTLLGGKMVLLQYAPNAQKQLNWTKGSSYGLEILQSITTDNPEITIDGNKLTQDQFVINETGYTKTVTIKISVLQELSVGQHTLVLSENNVSTTYTLNINEKAVASYNQASAGSYKVDPDSLVATLKNYEARYPDAVVSLEMNISSIESDIDESEVNMIKDRYGDNCSHIANLTLDVFVDGVFIETATEDMIANPVKIIYTYPVANLNNPRVVRVHDGALTELTTTKNEDGEGITIDAENNTFTLEASKFSTYALVVEANTASPATGLTQSNALSLVMVGCILVTLAAALVVLLINKKKKA